MIVAANMHPVLFSDQEQAPVVEIDHLVTSAAVLVTPRSLYRQTLLHEDNLKASELINNQQISWTESRP